MSGRIVILKYSEKFDGWWASWGGETFYDRDRYMLIWDTPELACGWLTIYHPELVVTVEGTALVKPRGPVPIQGELFGVSDD